MDNPTANNVCKAHSGFGERLKKLEANVKALWEKWDWMQKMIVGVFVVLCMNLIGVIFLLLRMK